MGLSRTLEDIVLGEKYNPNKHKVSIAKRDGHVFISSKIGTIMATNINGRMRLQDNGPINSWNTNLSDHIKSFKKSIAKVDGKSTTPIKSRVICFGNLPKKSGTYSYPKISVNRLNELYAKGYRYFLTTLEEHLMDEVLEWIRGYPETKWIHLKNKKDCKLPPNSISYDHRWYMIDILEKEFPNKSIYITRPEEQQEGKNVVLCDFSNEDDWKRLDYKQGYYYWSVNPTKYHHNSMKVCDSICSLIDDAIHVLQYYSEHQHKPENTPLGKYNVIKGNYRRFELFYKYVVHNSEEINSYIIHCP